MGRVGSGINFHVLGWVRCKNFGFGWVSKKRSMSNSGVGIERYKSPTAVIEFWIFYIVRRLGNKSVTFAVCLSFTLGGVLRIKEIGKHVSYLG